MYLNSRPHLRTQIFHEQEWALRPLFFSIQEEGASDSFMKLVWFVSVRRAEGAKSIVGCSMGWWPIVFPAVPVAAFSPKQRCFFVLLTSFILNLPIIEKYLLEYLAGLNYICNIAIIFPKRRPWIDEPTAVDWWTDDRRWPHRRSWKKNRRSSVRKRRSWTEKRRSPVR